MLHEFLLFSQRDSRTSAFPKISTLKASLNELIRTRGVLPTHGVTKRIRSRAGKVMPISPATPVTISWVWPIVRASGLGRRFRRLRDGEWDKIDEVARERENPRMTPHTSCRVFGNGIQRSRHQMLENENINISHVRLALTMSSYTL
jgi:hypothetical protein